MAAINILLTAVDKYSSAITGLNQGLELVGKTIRAVGTASDLMTGAFGLAFKALSSLASVALSPITGAFSAITGSVGLLKDAISGTVSLLWEGIKSATSLAWDSITSIGGFLYDTAKSGLTYIWDTVKELFSYSIDKAQELGWYLAESLYDTGNTFEQLGIKMHAIFGGDGPAQKAIQWAVEFAARTPLTMEEVVKSMNKLKAYGFDPMDGTLQKLGDTTYALGINFDQMVVALGQMLLKGTVRAQEMLQLANNNIPAYQILQEKLGFTAKQMANIGEEAVDSGKAVKILVDELGSRYEGAMDRASKTVVGALSTAEDAWTIFLQKINDSGPWDALGRLIVGVRDTLDRSLLSGWGPTLAKNIGGTLSGIVSYVEGKNFFGRLVNISMNLASELTRSSQTWLRSFLDAGDSLFSGLESIIKKSSPNVIGAIGALTKAFSDAFRDIFPGISSDLSTNINKIAAFVKQNADKIAKYFVDAYKATREAIDWVYKQAQRLYEYLGGGDLIDGISDAFWKLADGVTNWVTWLKTSAFEVVLAIYDTIKNINFTLEDADKLWAKIVDHAWALVDVAIEFYKDMIAQMPDMIEFFGVVFKVATDGFKLMGLFAIASFDAIVKSVGVFADALPGLLDLAYGVAQAFSPAKILAGLVNSLPQVFNFIYREFDILLASMGETYYALIRQLPGSEKILGIPKAGELTASLMIQRQAFNAEAEARAADLAITFDKIFPEIPDFRSTVVIDEAGIKKIDDTFNSLKDNFRELTGLATKGFQAIQRTGEAYSYKAKVAAGLITPEEAQANLDNSYMRIEYDAAEGTKRIFEKLPGQIGGVSDVMDQVTAKSETFLDKRIRELEEAGMKLGDKRLEIGIDMEQLEGVKAELLVSVQDMLKDDGTISEAEIMVALARFLKGQLVNDAMGENMPIVAVS